MNPKTAHPPSPPNPADLASRTGRAPSPNKVAVPGNQGPRLVRAVTVRRPASELYAFWRDVKNLERIGGESLSITPVSAEESHWQISAPVGSVEWDSLVINDELNRMIAWRSRDGAQVRNAGSVRFEPAPGDQGTEVTVAIEYDPPGGKLGALVAKLTGDDPGTRITRALRRFKALMETGEIPTTQGQPVGGSQAGKGPQ